MRFSILFDNHAAREDVQALWGFSLLIGEDLLFDTGSDGRVLLKNAQTMGVDLKKVNKLFLSHPHWDHIGGIDTLIEINPDITIYLPSSFSPRFIDNLRSMVKEVVIIREEGEIAPGLYSTGVLDPIGEQALIVDKNPVTMVVGCAHPGVDHMVRWAKEIVHKDIDYVIGGYHLFKRSSKEIVRIANRMKAFGVRYVTPAHCSGNRAKVIFLKVFGDHCIPGGAGEIIIFKED